MKKQSFIISAIILALGGFFAKGIGALYKIPLTNILGSGGMGLYYLVFPIYSLIITFCSSGISVALSTEVARCRKIRHRYNEQKLLRVALVLSFLLSLFFTIIILIVSKPLSIAQGNINATIGYIAIAPAIIISSIIATLRGYFQGIENMIPTTISMIIEQVIKLSLGLVLAHRLCDYGIQYAVLGAIIGVTLSEVVALLIITINFFVYKGQLHYNYRNLKYKSKRKIKRKPILKCKKQLKLNKSEVKDFKYLKCTTSLVRYTTKVAIKKLLKVTIPTTFASIITPVATMLDSFMIINILVSSGYTSYVSTSLYGLWGGVVQSLISLPIIIIAAISTSLVPSLSGIVAKNDTNEIKHRVTFYIKITWILSIIMFVLIYAYAEDILVFLYGDGLTSNVIDEIYYATKMLKLSSVSIIYYAFLQTFTAILQTIGKSHIPFFALLISLIFRTLLIYILVSQVNINIFGGIIANTLYLGLATIIMALIIKKNIDINFKLFLHLFKPLLIGLVVLLVISVGHWALSGVINYFVSMILTATLGLVVYILIIYFGKVMNDRERKYLTFGKRKLVKK